METDKRSLRLRDIHPLAGIFIVTMVLFVVFTAYQIAIGALTRSAHAQETTQQVVSLGSAREYCVDPGFRGGACANLDQFTQVDPETFRYFHKPQPPTDWDQKCTASFIGIPADHYVSYKGEDGITHDDIGKTKYPKVCELIESTHPVTLAD